MASKGRAELYPDFDKTLGKVQKHANEFKYRELRDILNYAETQTDLDVQSKTIYAFLDHMDARAALARYSRGRRSDFARHARMMLEVSARNLRKKSKSR